MYKEHVKYLVILLAEKCFMVWQNIIRRRGMQQHKTHISYQGHKVWVVVPSEG